MDGIREYLIGVVAAALLCGCITALVDAKSTTGAAIKLISALLMLLAVVRPWVSVSIDGFLDWAEDMGADGSGFAAAGESMADEAYRASIKQQVEAYILDEARMLDCELTVEVILSGDELPAPAQVRLTGEVSPYARQTLTGIITERLGIKREDLIWT